MPTQPSSSRSRSAQLRLNSFTIPLATITVKPQKAVIARNFAKLRKATVNQVLVQIATTVAQEIASRTPASGRDRFEGDAVALRQKWLAKPRVDIKGNAVYIGNLAALNQPPLATSRGTWRYGIWFNVEWGREYPSRGDTYIYQENPGKSRGPRDPANHPPGSVTPADIEMTRWIVTRQKGRGAGQLAAVERRGPGAEKPGAVLSRRLREHKQQRNSRESRLAAGELLAAVADVRAGQFGKAPIRLGYIAGINSVQDRIQGMMQEMLRSIGKSE